KIAAMQPVFKANRIYAYHVMYSSGFVDDVKSLLADRCEESEARLGSGHELSDRLVETLLGRSGRALWREMKYGAESGFTPKGDGAKVANTFLQYLSESSQGLRAKKIHLAGHSAGSLLLGHLLNSLVEHNAKPQIATVSLMAPTLTLDTYAAMYRPKMSNIDDMTVYNLSDQLELEDNVAGIYGKSILHLISRVLEEGCSDGTVRPLLGLSRDVEEENIENIDDVDFVISQGDAQRNKNSTSRRHGDFERDPATMNHILRRILGQRPTIRFRTDHFGSFSD
ncbi:MAG: alpha/beta hydrolase, partial [Gammaproteobacteria bacterium]|nr:alpha/beta hydrolase [Gammaproteobacteria bacterium]